MCHLFSRHHRHVENTSSYEPTWLCGTELNVSVETQKNFVLKFGDVIIFYQDAPVVLVQRRK